jgi:hypothetical protein
MVPLLPLSHGASHRRRLQVPGKEEGSGGAADVTVSIMILLDH